jgi:RimJ/RimL family protein N-acetyltransferase
MYINLKHCRLEFLSLENDYELFQLQQEHRLEYREKVASYDFPQTFEEFRSYLEQCFIHGRIEQWLVKNHDDIVVGTIYTYEGTENMKLACFFCPASRNTFIPLESITFSLNHTFTYQEIPTLHFSVYESNAVMLKLARKIKAVHVQTRKGYTNTHLNVLDYYITYYNVQLLIQKYGDRISQ